MITPRSLFVIIVVAQAAAYSVARISEGMISGILKPMWHLLGGSAVENLFFGVFDLGHFMESIFAGVISLAASILILGILVRTCWHPISRFLQLGNETARNDQ